MYAVSERVAFSNPSNKPDLIILLGFPGGPEVKASACNAGDLDSIPGLGRFPWRKKWRIPWTEEPGGLRSPQGRKESDTTEPLHFT